MAARKEGAVIKLVVLGDAEVGKTALTVQLCLNHFVEEYDPTVEDSYRKQLIVDHQACVLEVLDTAGREEYSSSLREQWIRDGEGYVLMYSITSQQSFARIPSFVRLIEQIKDTDLPIPKIIIGAKSDRVNDRQVSYQEGQQLAKRLDCDFYEVSAKNDINIQRAIFDAIRTVKRTRLKAAANGTATASNVKNGSVGSSVGGKPSICNTVNNNKSLRKSEYKERQSCIVM
ncbi:ras family-domain-containing protein [Lipomyces japonicus]|uniref:ras family-domain-containing protein n=1 Tax=Lipomyces japonicus TaxID=56871 RepID=UPI0034CD83BC